MIQERNFMNNFKAKFKNTKIILKEAQKNAIYKEKDMKKEMKKYISVRDSSSHMK